MNSLQIQYFLETARLLNFSKTAQTLYVSQSAVSRQIARLETELGVTLFKRSTHGIELTEVGEKLYALFGEGREKLDWILSAEHQVGGTRISIEVYDSGRYVASDILSEANSYMHNRFPDVEVEVNTRPISDLDCFR